MNIKINCEILDECDSYKYLGIYVHKNLSWKCHIEYLCKKISKACGALAKIRHCVDINTLTNVYYALMHSYLRYGIIAWGSATSSVLKSLQTMVNRVITIMFFAPFGRVDLKPLYDCLEILNLSEIYSLETGKFIYKSKTGLLPISNIANHFERRVGAQHQHNLRSHRSYRCLRFCAMVLEQKNLSKSSNRKL